jgi:hypothetical protein
MHFASLDGFPTSVVAFTTDIPVLAPAWGEPFLFGPGSIHVAHTTQEKISKRELLAAVDTYAQMTRMLLGVRKRDLLCAERPGLSIKTARENDMPKNLAIVGYGKMGRLIEQLAPEAGFSVVLKLDIDTT